MPLVFEAPLYLLLLLALPLLWVWSYRGLSGLRRTRKFFAIALRTVVFTLLVLALAGAQRREVSERMTVIYLLDQSLSIPEANRAAMVRYVNAAIRANLREEEQDKTAVIVFGKDAEVEYPPVDFFFELPRVETDVNREHTNLAGALERAASLFPPDTAKRVVIVTDGNENIGDALRQARAMVDSGMSIDVMPVSIEPRGEVSVDKVALPAEARRGQPFELRVVVDYQPAADADPRPVRGKLRITRVSLDEQGQRKPVTLVDDQVELSPGKRVFTITETIDQPSSYTYEAEFFPEAPAAEDGGVQVAVDGSSRNNSATGFTYVRGKGRVLLIEDWEHPGEFAALVERLRDEGLAVVVQGSNALFGSLAELQQYDTVVLANVPRSSGFVDAGAGGIDSGGIDGFTDTQIKMLVQNTEEMGCGLIMIGGDRSMGAGDWTGTELEKAMPVDFKIKAAKVTPVGALAMIMHACEIPEGNYWQKVIAREAVKVLGPKDYCGVIQWMGNDQWLWGQTAPAKGMLPVGPNRGQMMARIDRLTVGDMPAFDPAMKQVAGSLLKLTNPTPAIKHCIIISDGDPQPPSQATLQAFIKQKVKITTVAVGSHGPPGHKTMQDIANQTGGKYYVIRSPKALPRIYQREARRVAQPIIREIIPPTPPVVVSDHEILSGIPAQFPPISGYVQSSVKDSSLVEVVLRAPAPPNPKNNTLLATWTYGLGKTAVFTSDAGSRWTSQWTGWEHYDRFFSQMVRWSMRPTGDTAGYTVATETEGGTTRVIVDALDKDEQYINAAAMTGSATRPDLGTIPIVFTQVAPGRYVGEFESPESGAYLLTVNPGAGQPLIRTGVNIGYSDEFRDRETNRPLLESIASLAPEEGEPGKVIDDEAGVPLPAGDEIPEPLVAVDSFRRDLPPAISRQDIWPLLVLLGSCIFFADVFVRRVRIGTEWMAPAVAWVNEKVLGRGEAQAEGATLGRLQSRKRAMRRESEQRAADTRFEFDPVTAQEEAKYPPLAPSPTTKPETASEQKPNDAPREESYTERLLKAKRKARGERDE